MRTLLFSILVSVTSLYAANTQIQDTDYYPFNGTPATCVMVYQLMAGSPSTAGTTLISVPKAYQIVGGVVNLSLVPNDQINQPSGGTYYQVTNTCYSDGGQQPAGTETWVVPTSATPLTVRQVRAAVPLPGPGTIGAQQISCPLCSPGSVLVWNGLDFVPGSALISPMTTLGDTMYGGSLGGIARLPGDTSNIRHFLRELSIAGVAQPPGWDTLQSADVISALGYTPVTPTGTGASGAWNISVTGAAGNAPPSGPAGGDLCGTFPNPSVCTVGGAIAANINAATVLTNAATNTNTPGALVLRDASGNFSAGVITAALIGNAATATALARLPSGCLSGFPTGVDTGANALNCTVLPTSIAGTLNQIAVSSPTGAVTLSFPPAGVTLPGTTSGTFSGNVAGNLTGNASGSAASFTGNLTGDTTSAGMATTTGAVNGVSYPASPALHAVPLVIGANSVSYVPINNCIGSGQHLTFVQSTNTFGCDATSVGATPDFSVITGIGPNPNALQVSGSFGPVSGGIVTATDLNGVHLAALSTGLMYLTAGVPSIATVGNIPSLSSLYTVIGRNINTTGPLAGGGNLSADLTLSLATANGSQIGAENVAGTLNQIGVSYTAGTATLSIPTNPTLPGTTSGSFAGNLTGNVTGNITGTAATFTGALSGDTTSLAMVTTTGRVNGVTYPATPSLHAVPLVTTGNSVTYVPINNCTGSGQHLTFVQGTNTFGCDATTVGGTPDFSVVTGNSPNPNMLQVSGSFGPVSGGIVTATDLNGVHLAALSTGIVYLSAGVPSIATAANIPSLASYYAAVGRNINTASPLAGGGNLGADLNLSIATATGSAIGAGNVAGTTSQIAVSYTAGTATLSIPTSPTLPGTTTGTFSGNLAGNVTGNITGTAATFTGSLSGDTTSTGMLTTTGAVNGVSYPATPGVHGVPVVTAANTVAYEVVNNCSGGGNHLTFVQATNTFGCDATAGTVAGVDFGAVTGINPNANALLMSGTFGPTGSGTIAATDVNGVHLATLGNGLMYLTGGVPSIATASNIPNLSTLYAAVGRNINTVGPLIGGGNLSADLTLSVNPAGASQIGVGNVAGTLNQIAVSYGAGTATLSIPNSPTFPGTASGTFSGPLAGNVTGNLTGNVTGNLTGIVTGSVTGSSATFTGALSGDTTSAGMVTTTVRVNGVTYPANPTVHSLPMVTGTGTVGYVLINAGANCVGGGNHLNFTQATNSFGCDATSSGGTPDFSVITGISPNPNALLVSGSLGPSSGGIVTATDVNGVHLASLANGLMYLTAGVPSIATAGNIPNLSSLYATVGTTVTMAAPLAGSGTLGANLNLSIATANGSAIGAGNVAGTASQIGVSYAAGTATLSIPTNPTLPGTTSGTFSGNLTGNLTGNVSGSLTGNVTGNVTGTAATFTGSLSGDTTSTGMVTATGRVNGVTYPANPTVHALPIVSASNTVSYVLVNAGANCIGGGNHLNFTQATNSFGCDATSSGGTPDFSVVTGIGPNPYALQVSGTFGPSGAGTITATDVNGVHLASLANGLMYLTSGVPSIATASNIPSLSTLYAAVGRNINTAGPLAGGGTLAADLNLSIATATGSAIGAGNVAGTANQIAVSYTGGTATLSIPSSPTLPGTTTGTFSGMIDNLIITPSLTPATLAITAGKSVAINNSISFGGTDGAAYTLPTSSATLAPVASPAFTGTVSAVNETVSGNLTVTGTCTGCGSAAGAAQASQLGDFAVVRTSATLLTVGAGCTAATPCNTVFGYGVVGVTGSHTITISGGAGTIYGYLTNAGVMTVGYPASGMTIACSGCTLALGVTGFPAGSSPKYSYAAAVGNWTSGTLVDYRAFESGPPNYISGTGVIITPTATSLTFAADYSVTAPLANPAFTGQMGAPTIAFASLGAVPAAGKFIYCTNCTTAATCASGGTGHMAVSNGSAWACN